MSKEPDEIRISICTFNDGRFTIIFKDAETEEEISFHGEQELDEEELELANRIAPACVYTTYKRRK